MLARLSFTNQRWHGSTWLSYRRRFRTPFPKLFFPSCNFSLNIKLHTHIMAARFLDMALDDVAKSRSTDTRGPGNRRGGATRGGNTGRDSPARNNRSSPYSVRNQPVRTEQSTNSAQRNKRGCDSHLLPLIRFNENSATLQMTNGPTTSLMRAKNQEEQEAAAATTTTAATLGHPVTRATPRSLSRTCTTL